MTKIVCKLFLVFFTLVFSAMPCVAQSFERMEIELVTQDGRSMGFNVEVADTLGKSMKGLMFRNHLPWRQGMLFDFKEDQVMDMWMKNTYVPLDMLFINSDGVIFKIVENTEPDSTYTISSVNPGRYVLEIMAGSVKRFGIKTGDLLVLPNSKRSN